MTPKIINELIKPIDKYRFFILAVTVLGWISFWILFLEPVDMNTSVSFDDEPLIVRSFLLMQFWVTGISFVIFSFRNLKEYPGKEANILKKIDYFGAKCFEWYGSVFFTFWFIGLMLGTLIVAFKWAIE